MRSLERGPEGRQHSAPPDRGRPEADFRPRWPFKMRSLQGQARRFRQSLDGLVRDLGPESG